MQLPVYHLCRACIGVAVLCKARTLTLARKYVSLSLTLHESTNVVAACSYQNLPQAGLVLSVTHTESRILQFPCVCVCYYSSKTTGAICIKITLADRTYHGDWYRLVRFELFTTSPLKFIQKA